MSGVPDIEAWYCPKAFVYSRALNGKIVRTFLAASTVV